MAWWVCSRLHYCQNTTSSIFLAPKCLPRFLGEFPTRVRFSALQLKGLRPTPSFLLFSSSSSSSSSSSAAAPSSADQYRLTSPELVALEYADLNLPHNASLELGHVRIRQHVNPLSSSFSMPVQVPEWNQVFKDPTLPLMVDIGSGSGRFLLWLAKRNLGLVKRAQFWVKELSLDNIHFLFANATTSFKELVSTYPGPLMLVSILCPDPHFKKRHHKRRIVQKPLVDTIVESLMPGGQVFIQSDVFEVAVDMRNQFDGEGKTLKHIDEVDLSVLCDSKGWLLRNPMGIRTEREIHAEFEGAKIYRRIYQKANVKLN
ncbi:hypothetical protein TIFTF001_017773 [Ficus carica]|uniref:tRNA (guanine(46)-N(7))-methyltransferase n=1 Tax=Ficus carica TaxID=3494 RepID=A0AA88AA75_FICCA|nr:hypothetical protein TIFTF001_017773 [Ficus carica]